MDKYDEEYEETFQKRYVAQYSSMDVSPKYPSVKKWYQRKQIILLILVLFLFSVAAYSFSISLLKYKSFLSGITIPSLGQFLGTGKYSFKMLDCSSRSEWTDKDSCFRHLARQIADVNKADCDILEQPYRDYCMQL